MASEPSDSSRAPVSSNTPQGFAHALAEVDPHEVRRHPMPIVAVHQAEPAGLQLLQRLGFDLFEKLLGREALELAIVEGDQDVGSFRQTVDHSAAVRANGVRTMDVCE